MTPEEQWTEMMSADGTELVVELHREHLQPGATFSEEAMDGLMSTLGVFIGTRVMRRWEATQEPPSVLRVSITVEAM